MSKTPSPEKHASHESKDHGCGNAHKNHKPTPPLKESVAQTDDSKSESTHEQDQHSGCCGGGKSGK